MVYLTPEIREERLLAPQAARSTEARRTFFEEDCPIRSRFQVDRDRIIHSKAFRRLMHKTQVYINPDKDHYRTRLTHTLEVSQIARTIARALGLNEDLTEAISLGHDLGHTPYGHMGERILDELHPKGFRHNEQSLRVVEYLETKNGRPGLNLTLPVKDGILNHCSGTTPSTLEGEVVKLADRIAYINHDLDDAKRSGLLREEDLSDSAHEVLGNTHSERIDTLVKSVVEHSKDLKKITMARDVYREMDALRDFLFERVYRKVSEREENGRVEEVLRGLYAYYKEDIRRLPAHRRALYRDPRLAGSSEDDMITDYIAGMTDVFAENKYREIEKS